MFFGRLLAKFRSQPARKNKNKHAAIQPEASIARSKTKIPSQKTDEVLNTKNKINKALNDIENTIQSKGANSQLLLQKANILLMKGKTHKARQILNKLSKIKNNSKTSDAAKELLKKLQQLQEEADSKRAQTLANNLQEIARKYGTELPDIQRPEGFNSEPEIIQLVRKEAHRARTCDLPKLSRELIDQTIQAGYYSPWLLHDKTLSVQMMGQQAKALSMLNALKAECKGEKITNSINKNIKEIKKNPKQDPIELKKRLAKQSIMVAKSNSLKAVFPQEIQKIDSKTNVKSLVFKQARACLITNPQATLDLCISILDYFPRDLASLQLKGEALAALSRSQEAIQAWKGLTQSENKKVAQRASDSIAQHFTGKAKLINSKKSPKAALASFIQQHFKHNLTPTLNKEIAKILRQLEPAPSDLTDPELRKHQLQLRFNTLVIECLERQWRNQGRLDPSATVQKPGAISKTAPKAG